MYLSKKTEKPMFLTQFVHDFYNLTDWARWLFRFPLFVVKLRLSFYTHLSLSELQIGGRQFPIAEIIFYLASPLEQETSETTPA